MAPKAWVANCLAGVWAHAWEVTGLSAAQCGYLGERIESQVDWATQLMFPAGDTGAPSFHALFLSGNFTVSSSGSSRCLTSLLIHKEKACRV